MEQTGVLQRPLRARTFGLLRSRSFWLLAGVAAVFLAGAVFWSVRSYRRAQSRELMNTFTPFQSPPLGLVFPRVVAASDASRQVLAAGVREGVWGVSERGGRSSSLEVWLTVQGQKWFSVVGNQLVATFKSGSREVTDVLHLEQDFPGRRIRYRYVWREFHPGTSVLGDAMPEPGREYEGEALLLYEGDHWRVMHWTTPEFDQAVAQFKTLAAP
jgi:hypothetical protein